MELQWFGNLTAGLDKTAMKVMGIRVRALQSPCEHAVTEQATKHTAHLSSQGKPLPSGRRLRRAKVQSKLPEAIVPSSLQ